MIPQNVFASRLGAPVTQPGMQPQPIGMPGNGMPPTGMPGMPPQNAMAGARPMMPGQSMPMQGTAQPMQNTIAQGQPMMPQMQPMPTGVPQNALAQRLGMR
jgi:hypothetical protein